MTTYRKLSDHSFEEIAIPKCTSQLDSGQSYTITHSAFGILGYFQGAVYVTSRAKKHINGSSSFNLLFLSAPQHVDRVGLLSGTRFRDDVETLATRFDRNTKHVFRKDDEPHRIQFASQREHAPALNIRAGQFTLHGYATILFYALCILA